MGSSPANTPLIDCTVAVRAQLGCLARRGFDVRKLLAHGRVLLVGRRLDGKASDAGGLGHDPIEKLPSSRILPPKGAKSARARTAPSRRPQT